MPLEEVAKRVDKDAAAAAKELADAIAKMKEPKEGDEPEPLDPDQPKPPSKIWEVHVPGDDLFGQNRSVIADRMRTTYKHQAQVANFFSRIYNSVIDINALKSKWFVHDRALTFMESNIRARQLFSKAACIAKGPGPEEPSEIAFLHYDKCLLKAALSQFGYFCPVTWKNTKELVKCTHN